MALCVSMWEWTQVPLRFLPTRMRVGRLRGAWPRGIWTQHRVLFHDPPRHDRPTVESRFRLAGRVRMGAPGIEYPCKSTYFQRGARTEARTPRAPTSKMGFAQMDLGGVRPLSSARRLSPAP